MIYQSPKTRWLKQQPQFAKVHAELVTKPSFQAALDYALLDMEERAGFAPDMSTAAARHYMMAGARKFMETLLELSEVSLPQKIENKDNLPHI